MKLDCDITPSCESCELVEKCKKTALTGDGKNWIQVPRHRLKELRKYPDTDLSREWAIISALED